MKSFRVRYPQNIVLLAYAGVAVCAAVFGATLWRCIDRGGFTDPFVSVQYILLFLLSLLTACLLLLIVYDSRYTVTETELITSFAFIRTRRRLDGIQKIVFDKKTCRLAIFCEEGNFVLRLNEEWCAAFIDLLLSGGKHILYDETDAPEEKKNEGDDSSNDNKKED